MKKTALLVLLSVVALGLSAQTIGSEQQLQDSLMQMLARFTTYMKAQFQPCAEATDAGEKCGCFRSKSNMRSNEDGVRTNADMGMVCAFLYRYGRQQAVLPKGVGWDDVHAMAMQSLVFAYSTHKANRLKRCADGCYWGSTGKDDHVWESSLWAMSVAYSAFFLWEELSAPQRQYVKALLRAECQYELERTVPTGYKGDTKAEENGWEADVLAATLGLFPNDSLATAWADRLRRFAVNSLSHPADADCQKDMNTGINGQRIADLYEGPNLYPDYTLQNHGYFHTSYQNVVIQELGEAMLALEMFKTVGGTSAHNIPADLLLHNCREVCDSVLYSLALADGELAMPNGNDWSLLLYDQLTSYSTMACMMNDDDALLLEYRAAEMIGRRQLTTPDGAWLLRSDIGPRRMGVQAHRVMMSWLMHHVWPVGNRKPTVWDDFRLRHGQARLLPCQQVVSASTKSRFSCFGWSTGLKSYTGYIAPHPADSLWQTDFFNLVVPYKAHNTGNLIGWYEVEGRKTNAVAVAPPNISTHGEAWLLNGQLLTNDSALIEQFTIYSTPGNALVYIDHVRAYTDVTINKEMGALLAISQDEFTSKHRHYTLEKGYANVDNRLGVVVPTDRIPTLTQTFNNNSVTTALLSACHSDSPRTYRKGEVVGRRYAVFYSNVNTEQTAILAQLISQPTTPQGWNAVVVSDTDGTRYLLVTNFCGPEKGTVGSFGTFTLKQGCSHATVVAP